MKERHVIADISYARRWVSCTCGEFQFTADQTVIDPEAWDQMATAFRRHLQALGLTRFSPNRGEGWMSLYAFKGEAQVS
jgi:hypothetical protein